MLRNMIVVVVLMVVASCNQAVEETPGDTPTVLPVRTSQAVADPGSVEPVAGTASLEGTTVNTPAGTEVKVISIGTFDTRKKELSGVVAVEGRVSRVFAERGAFMLVDYDQMDGCTDSCCPVTEIPVRLVIEEYEGALPAVDDVVVLIADLTLTETGYDLAVAEVQCGGEPILTRAV